MVVLVVVVDGWLVVSQKEIRNGIKERNRVGKRLSQQKHAAFSVIE